MLRKTVLITMVRHGVGARCVDGARRKGGAALWVATALSGRGALGWGRQGARAGVNNHGTGGPAYPTAAH